MKIKRYAIQMYALELVPLLEQLKLSFLTCKL